MDTLAAPSQVSEALRGLEPASVWKHFHDLTQIPRESGNEQAAIAHVVEWAKEHGFICTKDKAGNLCVKVPGTEGLKDKPSVCLQGHIDMVCVKNEGVKHDFATDPISTVKDDENITADGTSLGADNGIGLAAAMAIATEEGAVHPPLELLITIGEETGFDGARFLDYEALGMTSTAVINLDNEQIGDTCIQSAGLRMSTGLRPIEREALEAPPAGSYYKFTISNLPGGHSAKEITAGIPNAIKVMAALLKGVEDSVRLVSINGGEKINSIPMTCEVVVFVPEDATVNFSVNQLKDRALEVISGHSGTAKVEELTAEEATCSMMTTDTHSAILSALDEVRNGVEKMHPDFEGLAYTSSNLGTVGITEEGFNVGFSVRSPGDDDIERVSGGMAEVLKRNGFTVKDLVQIATWNADPESRVVKAVNQAYEDVTGQKASLGATHGGLETGTVTQGLMEHLNSPVESVAVGPEINNPHSPSEYVQIASVKTFYEQLKRTLVLMAT